MGKIESIATAIFDRCVAIGGRSFAIGERVAIFFVAMAMPVANAAPKRVVAFCSFTAFIVYAIADSLYGYPSFADAVRAIFVILTAYALLVFAQAFLVQEYEMGKMKDLGEGYSFAVFLVWLGSFFAIHAALFSFARFFPLFFNILFSCFVLIVIVPFVFGLLLLKKMPPDKRDV